MDVGFIQRKKARTQSSIEPSGECLQLIGEIVALKNSLAYPISSCDTKLLLPHLEELQRCISVFLEKEDKEEGEEVISPFDSLPDEVVVHILGFSGLWQQDCALVCKRWWQAVKQLRQRRTSMKFSKGNLITLSIQQISSLFPNLHELSLSNTMEVEQSASPIPPIPNITSLTISSNHSTLLHYLTNLSVLRLDLWPPHFHSWQVLAEACKRLTTLGLLNNDRTRYFFYLEKMALLGESCFNLRSLEMREFDVSHTKALLFSLPTTQLNSVTLQIAGRKNLKQDTLARFCGKHPTLAELTICCVEWEGYSTKLNENLLKKFAPLKKLDMYVESYTSVVSCCEELAKFCPKLEYLSFTFDSYEEEGMKSEELYDIYSWDRGPEVLRTLHQACPSLRTLQIYNIEFLDPAVFARTSKGFERFDDWESQKTNL